MPISVMPVPASASLLPELASLSELALLPELALLEPPEPKSHDGILKTYTVFFSTSYENKNDVDNRSITEQDKDDDNKGMTDKEKKIADAIEFVSKVIHEKKLSKTKKAYYTATLYFFWLLFNDKKKFEISKMVAKVVGDGSWFTRCVRK
ncbi:21624_t:CDS:2 [Cetraspora pellucida]|uniref:21624_t:CDS:1 n=1 Tax=Cetraspora pellucida TaxID=1433469 RepID=A0A9N9DVG7_9GLOM|nr:21624_t:CDS:2 [Cetraspora pellucida]